MNGLRLGNARAGWAGAGLGDESSLVALDWLEEELESEGATSCGWSVGHCGGHGVDASWVVSGVYEGCGA